MSRGTVLIVGAGLVGSLLSIFLARAGYRVKVYERRKDNRLEGHFEGRSINLALSTRGMLALDQVGLLAKVSKLMIPMKGRSIHLQEGEISFQPYGLEGQAINSVSRNDLNHILIDAAETDGVEFTFQRGCSGVDFERTSIQLVDEHGNVMEERGDLIVGADGAFSAVRAEMLKTDRFNYDQVFMQHGYKELSIPSATDGGHVMDPGALHIWPRERFMLIALPNIDGTFTCTLFLPFEGTPSFATLSNQDALLSFFQQFFPDALRLLPNLSEEFFQHPTPTLVTIGCEPWYRGRIMLIGDACHAIVPFYGQGMNAGFEDCRLLAGVMEEKQHDWAKILETFGVTRKVDCDAIRKLALNNFVEMMDLVGDPKFLLRKKIEAHLHQLYPQKWVPQYSQVTFSHLPYSEALAQGETKNRIMDDIMRIPGIETEWKRLDFGTYVDRAIQ